MSPPEAVEQPPEEVLPPVVVPVVEEELAVAVAPVLLVAVVDLSHTELDDQAGEQATPMQVCPL